MCTNLQGLCTTHSDCNQPWRDTGQQGRASCSAHHKSSVLWVSSKQGTCEKRKVLVDVNLGSAVTNVIEPADT